MGFYSLENGILSLGDTPFINNPKKYATLATSLQVNKYKAYSDVANVAVIFYLFLFLVKWIVLLSLWR